MKLNYIVIRDSNLEERTRLIERHADALARQSRFRGARSATRSVEREAPMVGAAEAPMPAAGPLTGSEPEVLRDAPRDVHVEVEAVDAQEAEERRAHAEADPNAEAHGVGMTLSPIQEVFAHTDNEDVAAEIDADNAAALADTANWGLDAIGAIDSEFDGQGTRVAVIDSGLDPAHAAFDRFDFSGNGSAFAAEWHDFTRDDTGSTGPEDESGHGTHCAATILGGDVGGRRIGVAPGVTGLLAARIFRTGFQADLSTVERAIAWAIEREADVISMSLSFDFTGFARELQEFFGVRPEAATARVLWEFQNNIRMFDLMLRRIKEDEEFGKHAGCLVIAAAGNHSQRLADKPFSVPAASPSNAMQALPIGALRRADGGFGISAYSNGKVQFVAPGSGIVSAEAGTRSGLIAKSGTSMACPHAAGAAALWWQSVRSGRISDATATRVKLRLEDSASVGKLSGGIPPPDRGRGLLQAP